MAEKTLFDVNWLVVIIEESCMSEVDGSPRKDEGRLRETIKEKMMSREDRGEGILGWAWE